MLREDLERADSEIADASGDSSAADDGHRLAKAVDADATGEEEVDSLGRTGREDAGVLEK